MPIEPKEIPLWTSRPTFQGFISHYCECGRIIHINKKLKPDDPAICGCGRKYIIAKGEVVEIGQNG